LVDQKTVEGVGRKDVGAIARGEMGSEKELSVKKGEKQEKEGERARKPEGVRWEQTKTKREKGGQNWSVETGDTNKTRPSDRG